MPKKYVPFSARDSRSIEAAFQKLVEEDEDGSRHDIPQSGDAGDTNGVRSAEIPSGNAKYVMIDPDKRDKGGRIKVPVNEDYLFDVDIERRELGPVYWLGPIYDVRRGTWFHQDGSTLKPCDENLATQLEEGFLRSKPWRYSKPQQSGSVRPSSVSLKPGDEPSSQGNTLRGSKEITPRPSNERLKDTSQKLGNTSSGDKESQVSPSQSQTQRLFGRYMNTVITYTDDSTAWLMTY